MSYYQFSSVQFSRSVMSDSLYNPMDCSTPGLPVHHQLLEFTQTHAHWLSQMALPTKYIIMEKFKTTKLEFKKHYAITYMILKEFSFSGEKKMCLWSEIYQLPLQISITYFCNVCQIKLNNLTFYC